MVNMKNIKKIILFVIISLLFVPGYASAFEQYLYGTRPNLGPAEPVGNGNPKYYFMVDTSEYPDLTMTSLANHEAVCGNGNQAFSRSFWYQAEECTSSECKSLGKYWYAARKLMGCSNDEPRCLSKNGDYYYTIRSVARNQGSCSGTLCKTLNDEISNNGGKSCKIYEAQAYYINTPKSGTHKKISNSQPMFIADCNVTEEEENECEGISGCCVDTSKTPNVYYYDGQVVSDKNEFLNKCKCTEHSEYHYYILEDGKVSDSEGEFKYHCDCKVDNPSSPSHYYIIKDYKQKEVQQSEYVDHCKCETFENFEGDPIIYFGPNPPETLPTEQEQLKACKNEENICKYENGVYYGKDGQPVDSEEEYEKQCSCQKITTPEGEVLYYGPNPPNNLLTSEEEFNEKCANKCTKKNGQYYGIDGKPVASEEEFKKSCGCRIEEVNGQNVYYGPDGESVILEDEWKQKCEKHTCEKVGNTYYGPDGEVLENEDDFKKKCPSTDKICVKEDGVYYGINGDKLDSEEEYKNQCTCQQVEINGQTVYYGLNPPETAASEEDWLAQCQLSCSYVDGIYYDLNGEPVGSEEDLKDTCSCRIRQFHGQTFYYGKDPLHNVSKETMEEECNDPGPGACNKAGCCIDNSSEEPVYYYDKQVISKDAWNDKCCTNKYDDCCVLDNKYYLDGKPVAKQKCSKCKPLVSYHDTCQNPEDTTSDPITFSDGEVVGDLVKTSNEDEQSVNYLTYKEFEDDNIVKCVLEKKEDYAGNTLETKLVDGNNYCKVLCKEDFGKFDKDGNHLKDEKHSYGYSVAGMQDAHSGRYFRLSAAYNAKKTCYSSSAAENTRREIDLDKFNDDVFQAVKIINDNINEMNKAYVAWKYLTDYRGSAVLESNEIENSGLCTNAPKYTYETITYPAQNPVQPKKLEIIVDKNGTTDYHISYEIKEGNPQSVTVNKVYSTVTGSVTSADYVMVPIYNNKGEKTGESPQYDSCTIVNTTANEVLNEAINTYKTQYTSLKAIIDEQFDKINGYIKMIDQCTDWYDLMKYDNEPTIGYKYGYKDENGNYDYDYYEKLKNDSDREMVLSKKGEEVKVDIDWENPSSDPTLKGSKKQNNKIANASSAYDIYVDIRDKKDDPCIDDKYANSRSGKCATASTEFDSVSYASLVDPGDYYTFKTESRNMSNKTFTKKSIEVHYDYESPNLYATLYPSGVVVLREDTSFEDEYVTFDGLPVQLETSSGLHKFTFTFDNIGENFETGEEGRVLNAKNHTDESTVLGKFNKEERVIFDATKTYEYKCYYRVNKSCPTCIPECEGEDCDVEVEECKGESCCPVCDLECVDCIYSKKEYHLDVPTIPLRKPTNVDPSSPEYELISVVNPNASEYVPYNWNQWSVTEEYGDRYDIINDKAKLTIEEIETYGELIYVSEELGTDEVYENPSIEGISSPTDFGVLKVVMTPNLASKIRNYNKENGGFTNQTLKCYDYKYGSYTFEKIFCYSSFLDDYISKNPDNFTVYSKRLGNETDRGSSDDQNGYWQTFISQPDCGGKNCSEYASKINDIVKGNMSQIGGPSWR